MANRDWHCLLAGEVLHILEADPLEGLDPGKAVLRLAEVGPNQLKEQARASLFALFFEQFKDFMVMVLLVATGISWALGEVVDALTIVAIVILNAVLGFIQEFRAEKSMEALRKLTAPVAKVVRGGQEIQVQARDLVPGDLLVIETGDRLPADGRLLESHTLEIEEAALTGESIPVKKQADWLAHGDIPLGDRKNMVFMGTSVTRGRGLAAVVATGMDTEMGYIAGMIQEVEESETPLQQRLEQLGRWLVVACLGICAVVVATGVLRGESPYKMFLAGVSLAVAAIPEGLPAIVTVALAIGVQRMIRRNAVVRKLQAVETLGCATVICSDKTGTLTRNEMMVRAVWTGDALYDVEGDGYRPQGDFKRDGRSVNPPGEPDLSQTLQSSLLCSNAKLVRGKPPTLSLKRLIRTGSWNAPSEWQVSGDPTEGALVVAAAKAGYDQNWAHREWERILEIPFESDRRRMTVATRDRKGNLILHLKGAPDSVLNLCDRYLLAGKAVPLSAAKKEEIAGVNEKLAGKALRVLGIAFRPVDSLGTEPDPESLESGMVFLGLVGMIDPPRPEVRKAVELAQGAGVRTVMITGDHPATAQAIAREMGILRKGDYTITGATLDTLADEDIEVLAPETSVYARVSPQHKLRIVRALKRRGDIVAMTGDGVNDAPAVKEADIGVAMGKTGTDVTKEASSMVLSDDNYATIVAAIEEGRAIYDNIRKFIRYLLSCNTGEVLTMFLAAVLGLPLPLIPIQILWVNLVTDGLPAMALGVDPPDPDVMRRPPRPPEEGVFARRLGYKILGRGILIGLGTLATFMYGWKLADGGLQEARTMAFATLVMAQLIHVFDCRSERRSIFEIGFFSNPYLVGAVALSVSMLLAAIYMPFMQPAFQTYPLSPGDWLLVLLAAGAGEFLISARRTLVYKGVPRITGFRAARRRG